MLISGAQIRAARALLGWSQGELALAASVSERSLRIVEGEGDGLSLKTVLKVHDALEVVGIVFTISDAGEGVFLNKSSSKRDTHSRLTNQAGIVTRS